MPAKSLLSSLRCLKTFTGGRITTILFGASTPSSFRAFWIALEENPFKKAPAMSMLHDWKGFVGFEVLGVDRKVVVAFL